MLSRHAHAYWKRTFANCSIDRRIIQKFRLTSESTSPTIHPKYTHSTQAKSASERKGKTGFLSMLQKIQFFLSYLLQFSLSLGYYHLNGVFIILCIEQDFLYFITRGRKCDVFFDHNNCQLAAGETFVIFKCCWSFQTTKPSHFFSPQIEYGTKRE